MGDRLPRRLLLMSRSHPKNQRRISRWMDMRLHQVKDAIPKKEPCKSTKSSNSGKYLPIKPSIPSSSHSGVCPTPHRICGCGLFHWLTLSYRKSSTDTFYMVMVSVCSDTTRG